METLVAFGSEIKALSEADDRLKIGGYLVLFGSPEAHDATRLRDYFTRNTDFDIPANGASSTLYYHHGLNSTLKARPLGKAQLSIDDAGVWMEAELQARDEYEAKIQELVRQGKLGLSSGTASHLVERTAVKNAYGDEVHHIDRWPLGLDASLTPTPGEPRTAALCLKSLDEVALERWDELEANTSAQGRAALAEYVRVQAGLSGVNFQVPCGLEDAYKTIWEESRHPRDEKGRWTFSSGAATLGAVDEAETQRRKTRTLNGRLVDALMPASPHPFRAGGTPVRQAIDFREPAGKLRLAYELIHGVHGDGKLPRIPIFFVPEVWVRGERVSGAFKTFERGEVAHIEVVLDSPSRLLTAIHETGHFLDFRGLFRDLARGDFATRYLTLKRSPESQPKEWREFHRAVTQSQAWQRLAELSKVDEVHDFDAAGRQYTYEVRRDLVAYLMEEAEVFARAYAQYIAVRCPYQKLGKHLRRHIVVQTFHDGITPSGGEEAGSLYYPRQWKIDDFAPIMEALDNIFASQGWIIPDEKGVKSLMDNEDEKAAREREVEKALQELREIAARRRKTKSKKQYVSYDDALATNLTEEDREADRARLEAIGKDHDIPEQDYENE